MSQQHLVICRVKLNFHSILAEIECPQNSLLSSKERTVGPSHTHKYITAKENNFVLTDASKQLTTCLEAGLQRLHTMSSVWDTSRLGSGENLLMKNRQRG